MSDDNKIDKLEELLKDIPDNNSPKSKINSFMLRSQLHFKLKAFLGKIRSHKGVTLAVSIFFLLGLVIGYLSGGGIVSPINEDEVTKAKSLDQYQYLPKDGSLEEALASGHYSHCVVYTGIGLKFQGKDLEGNLVVGQSYLTYPANKSDIFPGTKVLTPLEVIKGDLGSPVKIEFKQGLKTKEAILTRGMMKKCLKKSSPDNLVQPMDF